MDYQDHELFFENQLIKEFYKTRLINIALSQFTYENLPKSCDRLFFEKKLLFDGKAALMHEPITDEWLSLGYASQGRLDIYGYPTEIRGVGYNTANVIPDEYVVFYDNPLRQSIMPYIEMYARLMAECHMTFRINLDKMNTPWIITCGRNQQLTFKNMFARIQGFQRIFFMKRKDDKEQIDALNPNIPYIGLELLTSLRSLWTQAISFLGVAPSDNVEKKERLNTEEVVYNREESDVAKTARGLGRLEGVKKWNELTGGNIIVHINGMDTSLPTDMFDREMESITNDNDDRQMVKNEVETDE